MTKHYAQKHCLRCGLVFQPTAGIQKYCPECRSKAAYEREAQWNKMHPGSSAVRAKTWYAKHKVLKTPATKICPRCGNVFVPRHFRQIWCSECQPIVLKEQNRISAAEWCREHPEETRRHAREWAAAHPDKRAAMVKDWSKRHPDNVRATRHKAHAKRRALGLIPLNQPFPDSEGHHVDKDHVIYIPKEAHKSISHNVWTGRNMNTINNLAYEWLANNTATAVAGR